MVAYSITTASADFNGLAGDNPTNVLKLDTNHFLLARNNTAGKAVVIAINTTTWAVTTAAAEKTYLSGGSYYNKLGQIDATHFLATGTEGTFPGKAQVLVVNTTTWAITTATTTTDVGNASSTTDTALIPIDTNHFLYFYKDNIGDGVTQVITVNTTTWAITTSATLKYDTQDGVYNSALLFDTNHVINTWSGVGGDGFVQAFTVNTTTWTVTTAGAVLEFDTQGVTTNRGLYMVDSTHFVCFFAGEDTEDGFAQVFAVNTTTWAITTSAARLEFDTQKALWCSVDQYDATHFVVAFNGGLNKGHVQVFTVNTSTWAVTTSADFFQFYNGRVDYNNIRMIDSSHFLNFYSDNAGTTVITVMTIESPVSGPVNIKSVNTNVAANIKSLNGNVIANIKSYNTNA